MLKVALSVFPSPSRSPRANVRISYAAFISTWRGKPGRAAPSVEKTSIWRDKGERERGEIRVEEGCSENEKKKIKKRNEGRKGGKGEGKVRVGSG